jgi:hypothetical protein
MSQNISKLTRASPRPTLRIEVPHMDTITILRATGPGASACKTITPDGEVGFQASTWFTHEVRECAGIEDLARILADIEQDPCAFIIRGKLKQHLLASETVRRKNLDSADGPAWFDAQPRCWVGFDFDKIEAPEAMSPVSLEAVEFVVSRLPVEFHDVSYVLQFSSKAGLERAGRKVRVHLWWWFDRPADRASLERFAAAIKTSVELDTSLFRPVQPHYTARPIFRGLEDPFAGRSRVMLVKKGKQAVAIKIPPERECVPYQRRAPLEEDQEIPRNTEGKVVDGRDRLLLRLAYSTLRNRRPRTLEDFIAHVWEDFQNKAVLGATEESDNVYSWEDVAQRCEKDWKKFEPIPALSPCATTPAEAEKQLRAIVRAALRTPGCVGIKATTGLGKSTVLAAELAALPGAETMYVEYYAKTRVEQESCCENMRAHGGLKVLKIQGRNEETCKKANEAELLGESGIPIGPNLCRRKDGGECEFYQGCKYHAQFEDTGPAVRVYNHAHLNLERKGTKPSLVVIDEDFSSHVGYVSPPKVVEALRTVFSHVGLPRTSLTIKSVLKSILSARPLLEELRAKKVTQADLEEAAGVLFGRAGRGLEITPGSSGAEITKAVDRSKRRQTLLAARTLQALAKEISTGRQVSHAVMLTEDGAEGRLCVRNGMQRLTDVETVIILDADMEEENLKPLFPAISIKTVEAVQKAEFVQVADLTLSKQFFGLRTAKINIPEVRRVVEIIKAARGERKLVTTYKDLEPWLKSRLPGVVVAHFGAIRGTNAYKNYDTIIVVGRNSPSTDDVRSRARALHYDSPTLLDLSDPFSRRYEVANGVLESFDYPDARLQAVVRSIREAETRQAVGRLRLVHATKPKTVLILSAQPCGLPIDRLVSFKHDISDIVLRELGGFLPLGAKELVRLVPHRFRDEKQAARWRDQFTPNRYKEEGTLPKLNRVNYAATKYRRKNRTGPPSDLVVDPAIHTFPEVSLPARLAAPDENPANITVTPLAWSACSAPEGIPFFYRAEELVLPNGEKICRIWPAPRFLNLLPAVWQLATFRAPMMVLTCSTRDVILPVSAHMHDSQRLI